MKTAKNKKSSDKKQIVLPAHLQMIADRFEANYKNVKEEYSTVKNYSVTEIITGCEPD